MSELIATTSGEIRSRNALLGLWWYRKFEVDKTIAEKDKQLRHQKYNRCLAMAKLCNEKWLVHNFAEIPTKLGFYDRWEKRWLELAKKFKEAY